MKRIVALVTGLVSVSCVGGQPISDDWTIAGIDRTQKDDVALGQYDDVSVRFTNGRFYHIPLYRAEPVGVLKGEDGANVLLVAGADCVMCDEKASLRFFVLGGPELRRAEQRYSYPGSLKDYESGRLVSRTRTLYGKCLSDKNDVVVWFEEYLGDDSKWHRGTALGRITKAGGSYVEVTDKEVPPTVVADRKKQGICKEMPGVEGTTDP